MSEETRFFEVTNISYADTMMLQASDLIKNYTRDSTKNSARFWPPSKGVFNYLQGHAPEKSLILNDKGEAVRLERQTAELKTFPVRKPVKMGMEIPNE